MIELICQLPFALMFFNLARYWMKPIPGEETLKHPDRGPMWISGEEAKRQADVR